ncbi:NAD(P)-dependent oxidoreductase [Orbus sturtevantii]|uniref:NAD(P)-dependent oxidoreductase n=1 Tax=Orbus sturtevantii TaxID=3074109 RepID=UPI00370D16FE
MKIAVIGANGKSGHLIAEEAITRGHDVTAIVRDAKKLRPSLPVIEKDLFTLTYDDIKQFDVIIDCFAAWSEEDLPKHVTSLHHLVSLLKDKPNRLLIVGGAGSLYTDKTHTVRLIDTPDFPDSYKPLASNMAKGLDFLRTITNVNWTYFSPAAEFIADGKRTGSYCLGNEEFFTNSKGESKISYADYAIAMIDEAEDAKHIKARFTAIEQ